MAGDTVIAPTRNEAAVESAAADQAVVDCGWGRLIFGQTFAAPQTLVRALEREAEGQRDVAMYVKDPHVVLAEAPQSLFLDPSHTFRLALGRRLPAADGPAGFTVRPARVEDEDAINQLYLARSMVPISAGAYAGLLDNDVLVVLVAEDTAGGEVVGVAMGVDHTLAANDPAGGSSLWALAVDPQTARPGVGEALVRALAEHFRAAGRAYMDLSVMHDNKQAIALYQKLGFERVPVYCIKKKNPINERLFVGPDIESDLNVYAQIIIDEARRRGIGVEIESAEHGLFRLVLGGRVIHCRESLSDLTSAVAMSRCDDKALCRLLLKRAGLSVPAQITAEDDQKVTAFLSRHKRVVVKPARGEQGRGVAVDLSSEAAITRAVAAARARDNQVIVEAFFEGQDLRIIVIDGEVVAAAVRRPPTVCGDGVHTIRELIETQSRRRSAATAGESHIPIDEETERCLIAAGADLDDVLEDGRRLCVRKVANLHTGGTIHDVTEQLHPALAKAAIEAARVLDMPVVGFDFIVDDPGAPDYVIIEANERPGLANHEPQPTAERFIDFLFPQTKRMRTNPGISTDR